ncbi:hypothetical protein [Saccharopolyspora sp. NPDC002686]|uniref:hypothetical protein n=1 Tax=Saccharopolyspora sp. NPDC002686 TaxID=3154541 RepID=UPI003324443C
MEVVAAMGTLEEHHNGQPDIPAPRWNEIARSFLVPGHPDDANAELRSLRVMDNLERLREPLKGLDLSSRDHALLAWIADQNDDVVSAAADLLARARVTSPRTVQQGEQLDQSA